MPLGKVQSFFGQRPWLVSFLLVLALTAWLGQGMLQAQESAPPKSGDNQQIPLAKVQYQTFTSQSISKSIDLYGRTAPDMEATLGAEVAGKIVKLLVTKGDSVSKGQAIAQIDKTDLETQLVKVKANLNVKQKEFNAATSLRKKGLQGEVAYATAQAALVDAKASVKTTEQALRNSLIKAPFDGVLDDLHIELGDFVGVGDPVASVISLEKVVIEADVSERHIQQLSLNQQAAIRFIDGETVSGKLRYISRVSSAATNTFAIEIEIANPELRISAGVSAEVELKLQQQDAIKVSSAMLALDEQGNLGVKVLKNELVHFEPIQLVKAEQDGVWLAGLGDKVDIITVGQGFVRDGDQVIAVKSDTSKQDSNNQSSNN